VYRYLESGESEPGDVEVFMLQASEDRVREAWGKVRGAIMKSWIAAHPCSRPWPWWVYNAPEPRRRLGGTGDTFDDDYEMSDCTEGIPDNWVTPHDIEVYNGTWRDVRGNLIDIGFKPGDFTKVTIDEKDPPRFESEASYLQRLGLLTPAETKYLAIHPELLAPELVTFDEDEDEDDAAESNSPAAVV
jgi:hypothetical protein